MDNTEAAKEIAERDATIATLTIERDSALDSLNAQRDSEDAFTGGTSYREVIATLTEERDRARGHLRQIAQSGDTLSPQEFINHAAAGCGVDRHEYAGKMHPHRSIVELTGSLARAEATIADLRGALQGAADQLKRHPQWDSHISGTWQMLADAISRTADTGATAGTVSDAKRLALLRQHHDLYGGCEGADGECALCSILDCPEGEPLHYHHDGCPACSEPTEPGEGRA